MSVRKFDIIVIGAGMAGASAGAVLSMNADVVVLEMEDAPGYHATGRSAAFFTSAYGNDVIRLVTRASEHFFRTPPVGFSDASLLRSRECLFIARSDQFDQLAADQTRLAEMARPISIDEMHEKVPILRSGPARSGFVISDGGDLDVDAIHQGYLRMLRRNDGSIQVRAGVTGMTFENGQWTVNTRSGDFVAPVVINAAGAWADQIGELAGVGAMGLSPKRRTAILIDPPVEHHIDNWPFVVDIDEEFYFKPDAGKLLVSPADETPSVPCDAQPELEDVAISAARFEEATGVAVKQISHRWAGLRVFARDRSPIVGFDPRQSGFFWLAGQGGYGIQTAPALAEIVSHLITQSELPENFVQAKPAIGEMKPDRFIENAPLTVNRL